MATRKAMRTSVRWITASQIKLERRVQQQAAHHAQQCEHQWRRWLRRLRGASHALSLHALRIVPQLLMITPHTSWLKFWAHFTSIHGHQHGALSMIRPLHFLLLPLPPVCPRLPRPPRAVPWAPLHEGHGKPAPLRDEREWGHFWRLPPSQCLGRRLTTEQTTSRLFVARNLEKMCRKRGSEAKSKSGLSKKPKLDNSRKLRGIYFSDPPDEEVKGIMKNARRKLEVPMPAAMLCRTRCEGYWETCSVFGQL